jgi:serine/threonine-protein kinase
VADPFWGEKLIAKVDRRGLRCLSKAGFLPMIGQTLGHYRIEARLGEGGMGVVYRARDTQLERTVALKLLGKRVPADDAARARLLREARSASALNHPNICTIYEVGEAGGEVYIAMEYVEGRPLSAVIPSRGLPTEQVLRYGTQMADALAHAHERGVIHRDLKSSNVAITLEGRAKILDFGVAKRLCDEELEGVTRSTASLTEAGAIVGTLAYLAPEVLQGRPADAPSDLWALGVVLYEMAAGKLPFQGQTGFELSSEILREPPAPLPPEVPAGLRAIILRCLAKDPGERYQRASELRAALEALQSGAAVAAVSDHGCPN